ENILVEADAEQIPRGIAGQTATEAILRIEWIANEVGDAANRAPRPVAVDIVEELDESWLLWLNRSLWHVGDGRWCPHVRAAVAVRRRGLWEAKRNELLGGADEIAADCSRHANNDDALVQAQLEAGADAGEVAVAAHQHEGVDRRTIKDGL